MNKRLSWGIVLTLLLALIWGGTTQAQETQAREAAISAAQNALGTSERPLRWQYVIPGQEDDTSLGCSLVTGTPLAAPVTVYVFTLTFSSGDYQVRSSADGTITQLCDSKFGQVAPNPTNTPGPTPITTGTCTATLNTTTSAYQPQVNGAIVSTLNTGASYPVLARHQAGDNTFYEINIGTTASPNRVWVFTSTVNLSGNCSAITGQPAAQPTTSAPTPTAFSCIASANNTTNAFVVPATGTQQLFTFFFGSNLELVGRSIDQTGNHTWYQVRLPDTTLAWVSNATLNLPTACNGLPTTATLATAGTGTSCFITPASTFSNVRALPSTDAGQNAQIFENTLWQVRGINGDGSWFRIEPGWIAEFVTQQLGRCTGLPVVDATTPVQYSGVVASSVQSPQVDPSYECPSNFAGYMTPRIMLGSGTARVQQGGLPNRIRNLPTTIGTQVVGNAQPGRTFDRVISGPACNEGFVWWEVTIDGIRGWTVESDVESGEYFIEPVPGFEIRPSTGVTQPTGSDVRSVIISDNSATGRLAFSPDGETLLATGTNAQNQEEIQFFVLPQGFYTNEAINTGALVGQIGYVDEDTIFYFLITEALQFANVDTLTVEASVPGVVPFMAAYPLDFSDDGSLFVRGGCENETELTMGGDGCQRGKYELWRVTDSGAERLRVQPAHQDMVTRAIFSPDGQTITTLGSDGVQFWNLQTGAFEGAIATPDFPIYDIAYSPDGNRLYGATCANGDGQVCFNGTIGVWDVATTNQTMRTPALNADITQLVITDDGSQLAVSASDGAIYVYNTNDMSLAQTLIGHETYINDLAFSPDGSLLASSDGDSNVRLWYLDE